MARARPLYDNDADRPLFVVPGAWNPVMRAIDRDLNVAVTGVRGAGKTTMLRQIQLALRTQGERVAFVDATGADSVGALVTRVRDALTGRPAPIVETFGAFRGVLPNADPAPGGVSQLLYDYLAALGDVERTTVLVDASGAAEAVHSLFGRLRDVLWHLDHTWIVALDEHERGTALKPPADAFFDAVVRLEPMAIDEMTKLLELRDASLPPRIRAAVAAESGGNPRAALRALNEAAIHDADPVDDLRGRAKVLDSAGQLGRSHGMLMAELLERGQASPSDETLQHRLGLSRARLTHLLRQLLEQGLVIADVERSDGPGRPKTVYRPRVDAP